MRWKIIDVGKWSSFCAVKVVAQGEKILKLSSIRDGMSQNQKSQFIFWEVTLGSKTPHLLNIWDDQVGEKIKLKGWCFGK